MAGGGGDPGGRIAPENRAKLWPTPMPSFPDATPLLSPCEQLILYQMPAFLLPHNLPWPPFVTLSPAVMPRQAFWRSPLCPWHTKL